jgi:hypothetical protein
MVADVNVKWARFVSDVVSPPVVWGIFSIFLAARDATSVGQALLWASIYVLIVCIMPVLFIALRVKQGKITDIHMPLRRERYTPFIITFIGAAISLVLLLLVHSSRAMQLLSLATMLQVILMLVITLYWQISVHMIGISGAVVLTSLWFGALYGIIISPLIIIVAAARLTLKRHTLRQVIVGALVGSISFGVFFTLVR